jgi:hypothetical protein
LTTWRAPGRYVPTNSSKAGLVDETRAFFGAYRRLGDTAEALRWLVAGGLPQRSRATRQTIARVIATRLTSWRPPRWVLDDLADFAADADPTALRAALLLHLARQDALLYDFVQGAIAPRWASGERGVSRADVQRFLDAAQPEHPEIERWTHGTREKLAGNVLTILRDCGLLRGGTRTTGKEIVEPAVPPAVADHLARLLEAEGVPRSAVPDHPDWHLWLFGTRRAAAALGQAVAG